MITVQACLRDIPHRVLDSPDDAVDEELELCWWQSQQRGEAVQVDRP